MITGHRGDGRRRGPAFFTPGTSLRGKFSLFVLLATLLTALVVTFVSIHSIREFLYGRIELKLPSLLQRTSEKLDLSYQQRLHEIGVFANSDLLVESLSRHNAGEGGDSQAEMNQFLSYLFENSPQFRSLFVLDPGGGLVAWAGEKVVLDPGNRRSLSSIAGSALNNVLTPRQGNVQIVSAPVSKYGDSETYGTLHAVIDLKSLQPHLQNEDFSDAGVMYLLDGEGRYIAVSTGKIVSGDIAGTYQRPLPRTPSKPTLAEYENHAGQSVLGSSIYLPRIDGALVMEEPYRAAFAPVSNILWRTLAINLAIVLIFSAIAYRIAVSITRPIDELSRGVRRIGDGEREVVIPGAASNDEIGVLTQAFNTMASQLDLNTKELERLSSVDELTQVYNYRYFREYLSQEVAKLDESGQSLALLLCDIDHFKQWNDNFGHAKGDEILARVASLLKTTCRTSDIVARYGGDEFAILAPNTSLEGALALAEKLRTAVAEAGLGDDAGGEPNALTISTGVSAFSESRDHLFEEADRALYSAKSEGRDCVRAAGVLG